jgi:hypothetical protein
MAGNTIYMQEGSNYIDIHDNEVVNLHIDKATVHLQDDADARQKAAALTENAEFMQILQRAVEAGFCSPEGWQYRWKVKVEAAYFASVASHRFGLSDRRDHEGDVTVSWIPFEALFGVKDLRLSYNDYQKCATKVRRKAAIDSLFR